MKHEKAYYNKLSILRTYIKNTLPHTTPQQADALFEEYFKILSILLDKLNEISPFENYDDNFTLNKETGEFVAKPEFLAKQQ